MLVRIATIDDIDALLALARKGGAGLTNLPPDRNALAARLRASAMAVADPGAPGPIILVLALEERLIGCGMVFPRIGVEWPFYSYRISRTNQRSAVTGKRVSFRMLTLTNDLDGFSEVGGLLVDPAFQGRAAGALMSRSRYLFIACHRERFGRQVIADLRGVHVDGRSPFWDAVGRRFYDMPFEEADQLNALTGNQMIADLGPRHPIHVNLLSDEAQAAIGQPHADGRRARDLLLAEGFREDGYVDIFDAGPTLIAEIDSLASIRSSRIDRLDGVAPPGGGADTVDSLIAAHVGADFRVVRAPVRRAAAGIAIAPETAAALKLGMGDAARHVRF